MQKTCGSAETEGTLNTEQLNKHLQIGCLPTKGQVRTEDSRGRALQILSLFQISQIEALGRCNTGSSSLEKLRCPSLSTFVTLKDSKETKPGYCINTKIGTSLGREKQMDAKVQGSCCKV